MAGRRLINNWWERALVVFIVLLVVLVSAGRIYAAANRNKIYPGVFVGAFPVGGLTRAEAEQTLAAALEPLTRGGLAFVWRNRAVTVPAVAAAPEDPDLAYKIIDYDTDRLLALVWSVGREGSALRQWWERITALLGRTTVKPDFSWRPDKVLATLRANFSIYEQPGHNARLTERNGSLLVEPEREGLSFDYRSAIEEAESQLESLLFQPITLQLKKDIPTLTLGEASKLLPSSRAFSQGPDITVRWSDQIWSFSRSQFTSVLEIRPDQTDPRVGVLGLSPARLQFLLEPMRSIINIEPQEPKFRLENNKVVEFKASITGRTLDLEATARAWEQILLAEQKTELEPIVITAEPQSNIGDLNNLGITELLGVGKSNFKGSPKNRRHNIAVGAAAVNGTLIPPGEEFSLLKTLGEIDAAAGYLPELVIKGNKTIPEYGGGLCQIGTTTFRGTLAAGLPVTERQNHSYAVTYYNNEKGLPGTDATIYNPKPDYRFKNDTANYVLITTRIEGDDLFFEYWGTKDGRQAEQSEVRVWDRIAPPPVKLVETLDLKPGQKKCTEKPHAGIKAAFDYKITYPDGRVSAVTFQSQYRPWQEVCLIGVEKLSNGTATSTAEQIAPEDSSAAIIN